MPNINIYLSTVDTVTVCTKLDCHTGILNKVVKATLLGNNTSQYYRKLSKEIVKEAEPIDERAIVMEYLANTEHAQIMIDKADAISQPILTKE